MTCRLCNFCFCIWRFVWMFGFSSYSFGITRLRATSVSFGSYWRARWTGWWSRALPPSEALQLPQQGPPACNRRTGSLWAGTCPRRGCAPPRDTDSGSCTGCARWWWCCHPSAPLATRRKEKTAPYTRWRHPIGAIQIKIPTHTWHSSGLKSCSFFFWL